MKTHINTKSYLNPVAMTVLLSLLAVDIILYIFVLNNIPILLGGVLLLPLPYILPINGKKRLY